MSHGGVLSPNWNAVQPTRSARCGPRFACGRHLAVSPRLQADVERQPSGRFETQHASAFDRVADAQRAVSSSSVGLHRRSRRADRGWSQRGFRRQACAGMLRLARDQSST